MSPVAVQYRDETGTDVTNLSVAMGQPAQVPCGATFTDKGIHHTARLIGSHVYCPSCAELIAHNGATVLISTDYPVTHNEGITCGDAIALPKPATWSNFHGNPGCGANSARLTAAAKHCAKLGNGYLPPSKQGAEAEPTSFFRQRLGINDHLIRDIPTPPPARKPTPAPRAVPVAIDETCSAYEQACRDISTVDWQARYYDLVRELAVVQADNSALRGLLWTHAKIRMVDARQAA